MYKCWLNPERNCGSDCKARNYPFEFYNYGCNGDCNILTALCLIADALKKTEIYQEKEYRIAMRALYLIEDALKKIEAR